MNVPKDLHDFSNTRVLVVGDVMIDQYWFGEVKRISPEAPVPVVDLKNIENRLGGAANVALNIHSMGAEVTVLGVVGSDPYGEEVVSLFKKHEIDASLIGGARLHVGDEVINASVRDALAQMAVALTR